MKSERMEADAVERSARRSEKSVSLPKVGFGSLVVWKNESNGKVYVVTGDGTGGVLGVELAAIS